ncbi:MAG TPA: membrane protein insertase YidC [Streptosporangiaceae bacterium]|nr:membrane protein insertase YidC [Streptosporangiaceae bacterium]
MSFLNPLYAAVAWVMAQIHTGLSLFLPSTSGEAWFLTIVLLVVAMRLLLVPLFIKQMHSMRKMSALNPQLMELRKKYKGDKQTLNEETMRLYRENGVNPLGGCLPLLAQMPMFFALFNVLRGIADWKAGTPTPYGLSESVVKSAQNANILGAHISDKVLFTGTMHVPLEAKIVILCAVCISVVTTFLTVRQSTKRGMTPQMTPDNPMAASQKYMAYIVPFFALSGLYWAFGLVLYWVTTNVWTLGQQYMLFKRYPPTVPGTATATGGTTPTAPATPAKPAAVSRLTANKSVTSGKPATTAKPAAAKPAGTARPASKPAPGKTTQKPPAGQPQRKKPQDTGSAGTRNARSGRPVTPAGQQASPNGSDGSSGGLLRRLGRGKPEPEPQAETPEVKLVRQQRVRQSRSKRSGKH